MGCEIAELGVKQFFTENEIEYTTEALRDTDGLVYKVIIYISLYRKILLMNKL